jgi:hypothetical protein
MITGLPAPTKYDLNFLQQWLERPNCGNSSFIGADADVYEKLDGLGTLAPRGGELDAMTRLFVNILPNLYHWGVVNPIHCLCGKWIKVRRTKRQSERYLIFIETRTSRSP